MSFYKFLNTISNNIGVGVSNKARKKTQSDPAYSVYNRAYNVKGQLASTMGGAMLVNQKVVIVGRFGNGAGYVEGMTLGPLAEVKR